MFNTVHAGKIIIVITYFFIKRYLLSKEELHHLSEVNNSFMLKVVNLSYTEDKDNSTFTL